MLERLRARGVERYPVVADAAYGNSAEFRAALTAEGHPYVVGVPEGRTWTGRNRHVTPVSVASHFLVYQQLDGKVSG